MAVLLVDWRTASSLMTPRKKKSDEETVQKVTIEGVSPEAEALHRKTLKASVFTERVALAVIGLFVALTACYQAYLQLETNKLAKTAAVKVEEVATKAEKVKQTLDESTKRTDGKLDNLAKTTDATHVLVNSASLVNLRLYAVAARRIATLTNDQADLEAAVLAEKLVTEHEKKQRTVDIRE
jgi:hypothetical protein